MNIGYARTSTLDQQAGFESQLEALGKEGCEKIFREQVSSVAKREELEAALDAVRKGDTFIVTKLDRLARSISHLVMITEILKEKKAQLKVLDMGLDTGTPNGRLMLTMLGGIAQFEREMMLERQREGIAKAKAEGRYKGRKPTAKAKREEVLALKAEGLGATAIAKKLGMGRSSVYRIFEEKKQP